MQTALLPPQITYLDEATTSWPKAPGVAEAVNAALMEPPAPLEGGEPGRCGVCMECRQRLAELLGVPYADRVILTGGATHALNIALFGLGQYRGARVITSCAEHEAVLRPLLYLRDRKRLHLTIIGLDANGDLDRDAFCQALVRGTSLVALTDASHVTGRIFEVGPLFAAARAIGAHTLLDASQTAGEITVHPEELAADMVVFSGHKRLRGPSGTGALYLDPRVSLLPALTRTAQTRCGVLKETPLGAPTGFDTGRPTVEVFAGLCAALDWHAREGAKWAEEGQRLAGLLRRELRRIEGVEVAGDARRAMCVPIVSLRIPGRALGDVKARLETQFAIRCGAGTHAAPLIHKAIGSAPEGTLRLSVSGFNCDDEIRLALRAVRCLAHGRLAPVTG